MIDIKVGIRKYRFENADALNIATSIYNDLIDRYHNENFDYDVYELQDTFEEYVMETAIGELVCIHY